MNRTSSGAEPAAPQYGLPTVRDPGTLGPGPGRVTGWEFGVCFWWAGNGSCVGQVRVNVCFRCRMLEKRVNMLISHQDKLKRFFTNRCVHQGQLQIWPVMTLDQGIMGMFHGHPKRGRRRLQYVGLPPLPRQGVERQQKSLEVIQAENARLAVESGAAEICWSYPLVDVYIGKTIGKQQENGGWIGFNGG